MVVPTYTYSLPRGETFDPVSDGTLNCGLLSEYVLDHPESLRSLDPCISCAAIGPAAEELFSGLPEYAYGKDCMWQRLHERGAVLCSINLGAGSTFLHWVEGQLGVPYRFEKQFTGQMRVDGELSTVRSTLLVRYLDSDLLEADFAPFTEQARRTGLYRTALVGRGRIGIIAFADMYDLVEQTLPQRPWFLTAAERHDTKPMPPFTQR
jgi:aminoglycoside 3-N-acetyltransferase